MKVLKKIVIVSLMISLNAMGGVDGSGGGGGEVLEYDPTIPAINGDRGEGHTMCWVESRCLPRGYRLSSDLKKRVKKIEVEENGQKKEIEKDYFFYFIDFDSYLVRENLTCVSNGTLIRSKRELSSSSQVGKTYKESYMNTYTAVHGLPSGSWLSNDYETAEEATAAKDKHEAQRREQMDLLLPACRSNEE